MVLDEVVTISLRRDEWAVIRIGDTRVRLDSVVYAWQSGESPEQIVDNFDVLTLAEVYAVISYYLQHRATVDAYLRQNREQALLQQQQIEQHYPAEGIRARLLARQATQQSAETV